MAERPGLLALAEFAGIMPAYEDTAGTIRHTTNDTRERLLAAMGLDGSTEEAARRTLQRTGREDARRLLEPVRVAVGKAPLRLPVMRPVGAARSEEAKWELEVHEECGKTHRSGGVIRREPFHQARIPIPVSLPSGYHTLRLTLAGHRGVLSSEQRLIIAPPHCPRATDVLRRRQAWGLLANLYTLRSERNWGVGDCTDLRELVTWCREAGAAFVGINPLHALDNRGHDISPYRPLSRLFRNILYLDVSAFPEFAAAPAARRRVASPVLQAEIAHLRAAEHLDYARVMALKRPVLENLYRVFLSRHRQGDTARGSAYQRYLEERGEVLLDFATFLALRDHLTSRGKTREDWHSWPSRYRNPHSKAVRSFRETHWREVEFHCYLQFELDCQLKAVATRAQKQGLALGLYQDLALGSSPSGSDTWAFPKLFLEDVSIGAPPDQYAPAGQDWALPPVDPRRLAEDRYEYWIHLVRAAVAHAGALRLDHVMGLFRQFWIPAGRPAREGAYVRYPAHDLLAILALESTRAGALVIGEDLGTVPRGLPQVLQRWGVLSTRVLYFERGKRGAYRPSSAYRRHALVSANTHDMIPLAGFWVGRDLDLRRQADLIPSDEALEEARRERSRDRRLLLRRLAAEGVLPRTGASPSDAALRGAVHAFLRRTPAALVGISLDDLAGELDPVNLPGVAQDRYPSWSRRMSASLEAMRRDPAFRVALGNRRTGHASRKRRR